MNRGKSPYEHSPHIKVVDAVWATGGNQGVAGVVLLFDTHTKEYRCYWGAASGLDEWQDTVHLANWGNTAPLNRANMWFGELQDDPFSEGE